MFPVVLSWKVIAHPDTKTRGKREFGGGGGDIYLKLPYVQLIQILPLKLAFLNRTGILAASYKNQQSFKVQKWHRFHKLQFFLSHCLRYVVKCEHHNTFLPC